MCYTVSRWDRMLIFGELPVVMMMLISVWLTAMLRPGGLMLAAVVLFATSIGLMFTPIFLVNPGKFAILVSLSRFPCFQNDRHMASRSEAKSSAARPWHTVHRTLAELRTIMQRIPRVIEGRL